MTKQEQLKNKMYKLLTNNEYSVIRTECDRIGRQIMELNSKDFKENK